MRLILAKEADEKKCLLELAREGGHVYLTVNTMRIACFSTEGVYLRLERYGMSTDCMKWQVED